MARVKTSIELGSIRQVDGQVRAARRFTAVMPDGRTLVEVRATRFRYGRPVEYIVTSAKTAATFESGVAQ